MAKTRDAEKAANIIRDAGGKITGRTRLQKIAFLLEVTGHGEGFYFEYRHYGPYSEQLASAISIAGMSGLIREKMQATEWGGSYSIFTTAEPNSDTHVSAARIELIRRAANADPVTLELAATAAFLAADGENDPWGRTERRKPEKAAARLNDAKALYTDLQRVSTSLPLPNISSRNSAGQTTG